MDRAKKFFKIFKRRGLIAAEEQIVMIIAIFVLAILATIMKIGKTTAMEMDNAKQTALVAFAILQDANVKGHGLGTNVIYHVNHSLNKDHLYFYGIISVVYIH